MGYVCTYVVVMGRYKIMISTYYNHVHIRPSCSSVPTTSLHPIDRSSQLYFTEASGDCEFAVFVEQLFSNTQHVTQVKVHG